MRRSRSRPTLCRHFSRPHAYSTGPSNDDTAFARLVQLFEDLAGLEDTIPPSMRSQPSREVTRTSSAASRSRRSLSSPP